MVQRIIILSVLVCISVIFSFILSGIFRSQNKRKISSILMAGLTFLVMICLIVAIAIIQVVLYNWATAVDIKFTSDISICAFDNNDSVYLYSTSNDNGVTYYYCHRDNNNKVITKVDLDYRAEIEYGNEPQIEFKLNFSDLRGIKDNYRIKSMQITIPPNSLIEIESNSETEKLLAGIANPYKIGKLSLSR